MPAKDRSTTGSDTARSGRRLVLALVGLGVLGACVGIAYQRAQTDGCLAVYGPRVARLVASAPHVELWTGLRVIDGRLVATHRLDVSAAKGLVHLRRGLVEDANFSGAEPAGPAPAVTSWTHALVFSATPVTRVPVDDSAAALLLEVGEPGGRAGWIGVVGQGMALPIGRIEKGLRNWLTATVAPGPPGDPR